MAAGLGGSLAEVEFLAEMQEIEITPNFQGGILSLIQVQRYTASLNAKGPVGPFNVQLPVKVPLWLAINLKKMMKCSIRPPTWLSKSWFVRSGRVEPRHGHWA